MGTLRKKKYIKCAYNYQQAIFFLVIYSRVGPFVLFLFFLTAHKSIINFSQCDNYHEIYFIVMAVRLTCTNSYTPGAVSLSLR